MPCLHDEPYAYLELFEPEFRGVAALIFLSEPEMELARRIHPGLSPHMLTGAGVTVPDSYSVDGFRKKFGVERPFLLYAGRREGGKNWEQLVEMWATATRLHDLPFDLVTMGAGEVRPPDGLADRVIDLGFVSDSDRNDAFAAASAYIQPSSLESFSRTVMEAWLAGTPVVANAGSAVVSWHVERALPACSTATRPSSSSASASLRPPPMRHPARRAGPALRARALPLGCRTRPGGNRTRAVSPLPER